MKKFCRGFLAILSLLYVSIDGAEVEKFEFQAEVSRMMDIIINSLYQKKEVFLREVISNSADALDKLRFVSLQDPSELGTGDAANLEIKISFDEAEKSLTIKDTGIGMTRDDLVQNLGTVAKSGTSNFMEQLASAEGGDLNLIGQFGVGFYSVYLVADRVQVTSKNNNDKQYIWESTADNTFTIKEDEGPSIGRGTEIKLFLKEDALEYMSQARLETLVKRYSEFVGFPIYLYKMSREEIEDDDDEYDYDEDDEDDDEDLEDSEDDLEEDEDESDGMQEVWEWVRLNDQPAIWTRSPSDISDEEYSEFYQGLTADSNPPFTWTHFKAEGEVEFRAILFIPSKPAHNLYENYHDTKPDLKLYVRKVLIKDDFEELLPQYLNFMKGVVDSDDLPLSVSRETIQQAKAVNVISKKLTKKALDMLTKLAKDEKVDAEDDLDDDDDVSGDNKMNYTQFYKEYSRSIKLGVLEDSVNKNKLAKLLRLKTTYGEEKTSLEDYVTRMQEWQNDIYFLTGDDVEVMKKTPFLKAALNKGAEVLLLDEPIDEYIMQTLTEFEGSSFQSLAKEGLKFGDEEEDIKKLETAYKKEFKPLTKWLKTEVYNAIETGGTYGAVDKVMITITRLDDTVPGLFVSSSYGHGANMEKIMRSQTLGDKERSGYMTAKKIMELNPRHPIVDKLNTLVQNEEFDEARELAWLLHDSCLMNSGFELQDKSSFTERFYKLIQKSLDLPSLDPLPMMDLPDEDEDEDEEFLDESNLGTNQFEGKPEL